MEDKSVGRFECDNCGEIWQGTRDLDSEEYEKFCPECNSADIREINDL